MGNLPVTPLPLFDHQEREGRNMHQEGQKGRGKKEPHSQGTTRKGGKALGDRSWGQNGTEGRNIGN